MESCLNDALYLAAKLAKKVLCLALDYVDYLLEDNVYSRGVHLLNLRGPELGCILASWRVR